MAKYDGTYSCGHEGVTNIIGPTKNREWIRERHFEKLCPDCWEQKRIEEMEKANAEALIKSKEMELPNLEGTEKQVTWANTLRQNLIEKIDSLDIKALWSIDMTEENKIMVIDYIINQKKASWFIDNRSSLILNLTERLFDLAKKEVKIIEEPIVKDIKIESTVYPENSIYKIAAEISIKSDKITVLFEKNDKFREIVKNLKYEWGNGVWVRNIDSDNGSIEDRAAELGNKLLSAGFPITITDSIVRKNAIEGNYELECFRWIRIRTTGEDAGKFAINWGEKNDKLYNVAKSLPKAKWSSPSVVVNTVFYKEVLDFANMFGFKFSKGALEAIEEQKNIEANKTIVTPIAGKKTEKKDGLLEILKSKDDIIDDLKD